MNTKMVAEIKKQMEQKTTDELLSIWIKNDREEWSNDAFEAIKQVLTARNVTIPAQNLQPNVQKEESQSATNTQISRTKSQKLCGVAMFIVGMPIIIAIVIQHGKPGQLLTLPEGLVILVAAYLLPAIGWKIGALIEKRARQNKNRED